MKNEMKMRRWIGCLLALCLAGAAQADNRSAELLAQLQRSVEAMSGYRVDFAVEAEGQTFSGYYRVHGDSYYMRLGQAEVYCDGKVRREIDPAKREVVVDTVDPSSRNILNNPTRAFTLLDGTFLHETVSEKEGIATLLLSPASAKGGISRVTLELDTRTMQPRKLVYDADGEAVAIRIRSLRAEAEPLPEFLPEHYTGFEIIDFR